MKAHTKLLIALISGAGLGLLLHPIADQDWVYALITHVFSPIGQIFLRLIFMVVVPMVVSALIMGVYELGEGQGLGKVASKTFFYTAVTSLASVLIGVTLVNVLKPGVGMVLPGLSADSAPLDKIKNNAALGKSFSATLVDLVPKNPLEAAVKALDGEMVSLMVFALLFGVGLVFASAHDKRKESIVIAACTEVFNACMKIVEFAMKLAPFAVFALVFNSTIKFGYQLFSSLLFYVLAVVIGLAIQQFVVYSLMLKGIAKRSPLQFFLSIKDVMLYAFATASSNATLPKSLAVAEKELGLPRASSRFVLTVGSTANQNGTALFEGITVLFLAQVYHVDLSLAQQMQVVLLSVMAGIGTAGVPGGSLPLIMILLQQVGIPAEGIGIVLGVDRFLDMCRTTVNVTGDLVIATLVGKRNP